VTGQGIWLQLDVERETEFYERHGFQIVSQFLLGLGQPNPVLVQIVRSQSLEMDMDTDASLSWYESQCRVKAMSVCRKRCMDSEGTAKDTKRD